MTSVFTRIQRIIAFNLACLLRQYEKEQRLGKMVLGPCDVLISKNPLRTRPPDLLFMGNDRWNANPPVNDPTPLDPAPELVIEILSSTDSRRARREKIADFAAADVQECWLVSAEAETVEVLQLSSEGTKRLAVYASGQTITSLAFPALAIAVEDIFVYDI